MATPKTRSMTPVFFVLIHTALFPILAPIPRCESGSRKVGSVFECAREEEFETAVLTSNSLRAKSANW